MDAVLERFYSLAGGYADRTQWPWSSRAWTFQEGILSKRTIHYGQQNLMWECATLNSDELIGDVDLFGFDTTTRSKVRLIYALENDQQPSARRRAEEWFILVNDYRTRHLTHERDRIMALVGVAQALQLEYNLTFLAGNWKESMPYGLLWYYEYVFGAKAREQDKFGENIPAASCPPTVLNPGIATVPSWSWFGQPRYKPYSMQFPDVIDDGNSWLSALAQFEGFCWPGHARNESPEFALLDFSGLSIELIASTYSTTLRLRSDNPYYVYSQSYECPSLFNAISSTRGVSDVDLNYYCDDLHEAAHDLGHIVLALVVEWRCFRDGSDSSEAYGLGLRPGPRDGTWVRHGFWRYEVWRKKEDHDSANMGSRSVMRPGRAKTRLMGKIERMTNEHDSDSEDPLTTSGDFESRCPSEDIRSMVDEDEEKDGVCTDDSLFLQLPGVKLQAITLV